MTAIGEMHGLDRNDPWQRPRSQSRQRQEEIAKRRFDTIQQIPDEAAPFVDPPNDELTIIGDRAGSFWRITIPTCRLGDLVKVLPNLPSICYMMRNNKAGCWMALTSRRVAQRTVQILREFGVQSQIVSCDQSGNELQLGTQLSEAVMFCLGVYRDGVLAYFVPEEFWNQNQCMSNDIALVERLKPDFHPTETAYCFRTDLPLAKAKQRLDNMEGFRENLLVQAFVNETFL